MSHQIMENQRTAIMGFGNPVRSDDAVGIYIIERLHQILPKRAHISLFDMGTSAFEVLFKLKGHSKIIVVDAVTNTNEAPGTVFKLPASAVERAVVDDPMVFLHSLKWDQALSYARKILHNEYPDDIQVYLVAVQNTQLNVQLSDPVKNGGDEVVQHIMDDLVSNENI